MRMDDLLQGVRGDVAILADLASKAEIKDHVQVGMSSIGQNTNTALRLVIALVIVGYILTHLHH